MNETDKGENQVLTPPAHLRGTEIYLRVYNVEGGGLNVGSSRRACLSYGQVWNPQLFKQQQTRFLFFFFYFLFFLKWD